MLYPLEVGNQWVYQYQDSDAGGQVGLSVSQVEDSQATLQTLSLGTGITSTTTLMCDGGAVTGLPFTLLGALFTDISGTLEVETVAGVFAPSYETFAATGWDYHWEGSYLLTGVLRFESEGQTYTAYLDESSLNLAWRTAGGGEGLFDAVQVAAGSFPRALKIYLDAHLDFQVEAQGFKLPAKLALKNTLWFAPHTGLLKQRTDQADLTVFGGTYPVVVTSALELVEFRPGK